MRVLVQWTKANPEDWVELDIRDTPQLRRAWERLSSKPEPQGGEAIDNNPGWIFDINVQGVLFAGHDHYSVGLITSPEFGIRVTVWNDDPEDYPPGERYAQVFEFFEPAPDPRYGGQVNTRQRLTVYDERIPSPWEGTKTSMGPVTVRPWSEFVPPSNALTRHGIWVDDSLLDQHKAVRSSRGWRDWVNG